MDLLLIQVRGDITRPTLKADRSAEAKFTCPDQGGEFVAHGDTTGATIGERRGRQASNEYEVVVELARLVGIEIEEG